MESRINGITCNPTSTINSRKKHINDYPSAVKELLHQSHAYVWFGYMQEGSLLEVTNNFHTSDVRLQKELMQSANAV